MQRLLRLLLLRLLMLRLLLLLLRLLLILPSSLVRLAILCLLCGRALGLIILTVRRGRRIISRLLSCLLSRESGRRRRFGLGRQSSLPSHSSRRRRLGLCRRSSRR